MILIAISLHRTEGKMGAGGETAGKILDSRFFKLRKPPFDIKMVLQKGDSRVFAEKGRSLDPLIARLHYIGL